MRIVLAPDAYKGSMTAEKVGKTMRDAILAENPQAMVDLIPMADGGEGTIDALLFSLSGEKIPLTVTGATGQALATYYGVLTEERTAVIEIATVVGFDQLAAGQQHPAHLTTYGVGECLVHALNQGFRKIVICLGGSRTNDGGMGMLQALGVRFYRKDGEALQPYPVFLSQIHAADYSGLDPRLKEAELTIASDVTNPLSGPNGAAYIFGPQKGLAAGELAEIDQQMKKYAAKIKEDLQKDYSEMMGAGAAGGLGFALLTIGGKTLSGGAYVAEKVGLADKIASADFVITGEGKTDEQTLQGKLPAIVAQIAAKKKVPLILISGAIPVDLTQFYPLFQSMHAIASGPMHLEESIKKTERLLAEKVRNIIRLMQVKL